MIIGFVIFSIVAVIFFAIGFNCRKSHEAAGFFTFVKPPTVVNIERYNHAVASLWFVAAGVLEIIGVPFLFLEQNSPLSIMMILAVMILIIGMMIAYFKIEAKYRK